MSSTLDDISPEIEKDSGAAMAPSKSTTNDRAWNDHDHPRLQDNGISSSVDNNISLWSILMAQNRFVFGFWMLLRFLCITIPILLVTGLRLILFCLVLSPGFVRFAYYYWFVSHRHVVHYGNAMMQERQQDKGAEPSSLSCCSRSNVKTSCRQTLDIYYPPTTETVVSPTLSNVRRPRIRKLPVVVFYTGGAWLIGYKMWGALLARTLVFGHVIVVIPDYRNYPFWGAVPDMIEDVDMSLSWIRKNIGVHNLPNDQDGREQSKEIVVGDPQNIVVVGQSAGGHLAATTLIRQAIDCIQAAAGTKQSYRLEESQELGTAYSGEVSYNRCAQLLAPIDSTPSLSTPKLVTQEITTPYDPLVRKAANFKGLITLSAPFDLEAMQGSFQKYGLDSHMVDRIFGGQKVDYDPFRLVEEFGKSTASLQFTLASALPPIRIYHGDKDKTVPHQGSVDFSRALQDAGVVNVQFESYHGWSHTDAILEGPMRADHRFHEHVLQAVQEWAQYDFDKTDICLPRDPNHPSIHRLCPELLVKIGRFFMPF